MRDSQTLKKDSGGIVKYSNQRRLGMVPRAMFVAALLFGGSAWAELGHSRLSDQPVPFRGPDEMPPLTPPILEFGDVFLRPGNIKPGFTLPTGAVWQPRFWIFGTLRSSFAGYDTGGAPARAARHRVEWFNRADIFGNLQLTGSERLLIGITPLSDGASFTGKPFKPSGSAFQNEVNTKIRTFFFEGDIGQIFPRLDPNDTKGFDIGFSIGRQEVNFQGGMLINDSLDALGITKNNIRIEGLDWLNNLRVTGLAAWNGVNRNSSAVVTASRNVKDPGARLYGLFTSMDTVFGNNFASTIDADLVFVDGKSNGSDDVWVGGIGATHRLGHVNNTLRLLGSRATGRRTVQSNNGTLLFNELSWSPAGSDNIAYANMFWGNNHFTSASRGGLAGGPLGRVGLMFAARGVGGYPAPLGNRSDDAVGGALGYQMFFDQNRRQVTLEIGARHERQPNLSDSVAVGIRLQQALGQRFILDIEAFRSDRKRADNGYGWRLELLYKL
ncbi:MAG: hypothetical protein ABIN37_04265 [Burkholderiaceae bacterium]